MRTEENGCEFEYGGRKRKRRYQFGQSLKHSKNEVMGIIFISPIWKLFSKKA